MLLPFLISIRKLMNIFHDSSLRNNEHKCCFFLNESQDGFIFNYFEKVMYLEYALREPGYTRTLFEEKKEFQITFVSCCVDNAALFVYRNSPTESFGSVDLMNCMCLCSKPWKSCLHFSFHIPLLSCVSLMW